MNSYITLKQKVEVVYLEQQTEGPRQIQSKDRTSKIAGEKEKRGPIRKDS
jgi:hypothetical protein